MRKYGLLFLFFLPALHLLAQKNGLVKGTLLDTATRQVIAGATVTIMDKKDSSLVTFTQTDNLGKFELRGIANGDYRLLLTHVNYHSQNLFFSFNGDHTSRDFGTIPMTDLSKTLGEVIVTDEGPPITLIKDTIQYNAGSFKTQPNANVEQLLKKLPGVKVDKDGTIKAQGEKVNRVLVDGKEFFGDDPKIATRNLPADAIDKVQVYDKQSDQAQLTGFEDGNYEKTINLKLKKDKKKGAFGKSTAGAGTDGRYEGKFNINSFKGARQFSAIGMGNNTNAEGFSFMDILNFTGELARMQRGATGGNININISGDDAAGFGLGGNRNSGIVTAWGGGMNYNNIIGNRTDFQSNYFYNRYNPRMESTLERQYFLPDSSYFYNQHSAADNLNKSHRLNFNLLFQLDSSSTLRIVPSLSYQQTRNRSQSAYQTLTAGKDIANEGSSNSTQENEGYNFRNEIIYRKKFKKRGRTFSASLQTSFNKSTGDQALFSINNFYTGGALFRRDTLDQRGNTTGDLRGYNSRLVYTEPLWKRSLIEFSLGRNSNKSTAHKDTRDYDPLSGKYDHVNQLLSNDFENQYNYTNTGVRIRTQKRKYNYSLGASWQWSALKGKLILPGTGGKDSLISKSFHNLLPNFRFQYNFSKFRSLSINYSTATNPPTVSQLQPVPDNSNPLNIVAGNPDLRQEFIQTLMGNFNLRSPYKNRNLFLFFNLQATNNKIVNDDTIDSLGIKTTRPVNVNGVYNLNSSISYSFPVRWLKGSLEVSSDLSYFKGKQFINGSGNTIKSLGLGPVLRLDMNPDEKLTLALAAGLNYNHSSYSLQPTLDANYFSQEYSSTVDWELPHRFFFSTDFTYTINTQRAAGFNTNLPIWNASISRQVLKFNRGELKFAVKDLLDRNLGVTRSSNQNYIEDSRVRILRRFFLLSFTYSLSKMGLARSDGGGMRVIAR